MRRRRRGGSTLALSRPRLLPPLRLHPPHTHTHTSSLTYTHMPSITRPLTHTLTHSCTHTILCHTDGRWWQKPLLPAACTAQPTQWCDSGHQPTCEPHPGPGRPPEGGRHTSGDAGGRYRVDGTARTAGRVRIHLSMCVCYLVLFILCFIAYI